MQRAARWLAGALAVVVPMLVQRHWLKETYFVADDFANFALARLEGLTPHLLTANYNPWNASGVHVAPGHRVLDWLVTVPAGNRHGAAILAMVASTGGTLAFTLGTLDALLGRRWLHYPIVFVLGLAFPLLITGSWFAAGAHALPGLCFVAGTMWGYARWKRGGGGWALAATFASMALGLSFSPQPVIAVLYVALLSVLVVPDRVTPRAALAALRADWKPLGGLALIGGAYFAHEAIRSDAPAPNRTLHAYLDLVDAMLRGALPNVAGLSLPGRPLVLIVLAVLVAAALSLIGRRGLEALAFFAVALLANAAVIWFGRSDVGVPAATEARYLTALTLAFWVAVAIAVAPAPRGPWRRLPDLRARLAPRTAAVVGAAALVLVSAAAAKHYLGRLADGFRGSQYTLQTSAAARGLAYRLDRDLNRLDRAGELPGLVNGEVPFPFYYSNHPVNQVGYLGHAFNDHVKAEGRGPHLFMLTPDAEIKPARFTAASLAGPHRSRPRLAERRRCDGECELTLGTVPSTAAQPAFLRLSVRAPARVTATAATLARGSIKQLPVIGADANGVALRRWDVGPVALGPHDPDVTLQTFALDLDEVRVHLRGRGSFAVTAQLGAVTPSG